MAFLQIIFDNILPLLIFVGIGYVLDLRFKMDILSLNKLTFYIVLPSFIFYSIYVADLDMTMLNVFILAFVQMFLVGFISWLYGKIRGLTVAKTEALKNGTMFSNNGNVGIALIALVFGNAPYVINGEMPYLAQASACATIMLVQMNMSLNTLGLYQAGKGKLTAREALAVVFHMPVLYTLMLVFTIKFSGFDMTQLFIWPVFENCAQALVAIVMIALGMQIHKSTIVFQDIDAWAGCFIRLVMGPVCGLVVITLSDIVGFHFSPTIKQTILIMSSVPAPVNSVLYAVEFHNCEDFATELVMMSTLLSCVTMTGVIYAARILSPVF